MVFFHLFSLILMTFFVSTNITSTKQNICKKETKRRKSTLIILLVEFNKTTQRFLHLLENL